MAEPVSAFQKDITNWQEQQGLWQKEVERRQGEVTTATSQAAKGFMGIGVRPKMAGGLTIGSPFRTGLQMQTVPEQYRVRNLLREDFVDTEDFTAKYQMEQTLFKSAFKNMSKAEWYGFFYSSVENLVRTGEVSSLDDWMAVMKSSPEGILDPEDYTTAEKVIADLKVRVSQPPQMPEALVGLQEPLTPDEEAIVKFLTVEPVVAATTMQRVTIDSIIQALTGGRPAPQLPTGTSIESFLGVAANMGISEEQAMSKLEFGDAMDEYGAAWSEHETMRKESLSGINPYEVPEIEGFWPKVMFTVSQPMTVVADVMQPYIENVSYPLQGMIWINAQRLIEGTQDLETQFDALKSSGELNTWKAYGRAWEEWEAPWGLKLASEIFLDPLTYIPGLAFSVPGKIVGKAGVSLVGTGIAFGSKSAFRLGKGLTYLGEGAIAFNKGLWVATDIPFNAFKAGWKAIPKATSQVITREFELFGSVAITVPLSYVKRFKGISKLPSQLTVEDMAETMQFCIKRAKELPLVEGDVYADFGRYLMEFKALEPDDILRWAKSLDGLITPEDVNHAVVDEVNNILADVVHSGGNAGQNAKRMAIVLGVDDTPAVHKQIIKQILGYTENYTNRVDRIINLGRNTKLNPVAKMYETLMSTQRKLITDFASSTYFRGRYMSGVMSALVGKVDLLDHVIWRRGIDRWAVRPIAEANLGNPAYPLWNAFESQFLSALEGVMPRQQSLESFLTAVGDLQGVDYRLLTGGASDIQGMLNGMPGRSGAISYLPGKIPEKILGKMLPKWLGGKDYLEWTGRKWIEYSDLWGNAYRRNFVWSKYDQFLASYSKGVQLGAKDLNQVFDDVIGKIPKVNRDIGITDEVLRKEAFRRLQAALSAKDLDTAKSIIQDMKSFVNNTELMRKEQLKIMNQATELSPQARTLGENAIARGEVMAGAIVDDVPFQLVSQGTYTSYFNLMSGNKKVGEFVLDAYGTASRESLTVNALWTQGISEQAIEVNKTFLKNALTTLEDEARKRGKKFIVIQHRGRNTEIYRLAGFEHVIDKTHPAIDFMRKPVPPAPTDFIKQFCSNIADQSIADLKAVAQQADSFKWMADSIEEMVIDSPDNLMQAFRHYEVMTETAGGLPHFYLSDVFDQADELIKANKFNQMDDLWRKSRADLGQIIDNIDLQLERVRSKVQAHASLLPQEQADAMLDIIEKGTKLDVIKKSSLELDRNMLDDFWALPKSARTPEAHQALRVDRDLLWDTFRQEKAVVTGNDFWARRNYANLYNKMPAEKLNPVDASARALSRQDVAHVMGCNIDNLTTGLTENLVMQDKHSFIQVVLKGSERRPDLFKGFTVEKIGDVYDSIVRSIGMKPGDDIAKQKILQQVAGIENQMRTLKMTKSLSQAEEAGVGKWIDGMTSGLEKNFYEGGKLKPELANFQSLRQTAMDSSMKEYLKVFADYTNQNVIDFAMKHIYPYWTYHMYRYTSLLPRTMLRKPGVGVAWGKYNNYADKGYVHIPGTDLEANPFVGSGWGLTFSLTRHDYPSYYENLGAAGEVLDWAMRSGFYPGVHMMAPVVLSPMFSDRPPELGDILPPIGKTALEVMVNSPIKPVSEAAQRLRDKIFHENFRDYYTTTIIDTIQVNAGGKLLGGVTGQDLWNKRNREEALSEEEQALWDRASKATGLITILRSMTPGLRLRPAEYLNAYKDVTTIFEEAYGMSPEYQMDLWRHNIRPTDVIGGLDPDVEASLDELWKWKAFLGRGVSLLPPEQGDLYSKMDKFWNTVETYQVKRQTTQRDIDTGFMTPTDALHFDGREWRAKLGEKWNIYGNEFEALKNDPDYADVQQALTVEGQMELARKKGFAAPSRHPMDEVMDLYFSIEPKIKKDKYTGEEETDWQQFYTDRQFIRNALTEEQRVEFDTKIRAYETPLEAKFREVSDTYFRGYWATSRIILDTFDEEQKALIAEYYADTTSLDRKEEIQEVAMSDGTQLISSWNTQRSEGKAKLRDVSPQLDFWLYVFGYISNVRTDEARAMVNKFEQDKTTILTQEW